MDNILNTIFSLVGTVIAIALVILMPKLKAYLSATLGEAESEKLIELVSVLVHSAQQTMWDKTGVERKAYVVEQLKKLGYQFTDYINDLIESEVFTMNQE